MKTNKYLTKVADMLGGSLTEQPTNQLGSTTEREKYSRLGSFFVGSKNEDNDTAVNKDSGSGVPV